jgi:hypothetical protein
MYSDKQQSITSLELHDDDDDDREHRISRRKHYCERRSFNHVLKAPTPLHSAPLGPGVIHGTPREFRDVGC